MNLQGLYFAVKERIDKVDIPSLWHGFQPLKFALPIRRRIFKLTAKSALASTIAPQ